jgi:hypothetical protein
LLQEPEPPSDDADTGSETDSEQDEKKKEELDRIEGIEPIIAAEPGGNIPDTSAKAEKVLDEILSQQTPRLNGENDGLRLGDALNRVNSMPGTAQEKASAFEAFATQISVRSTQNWRFSSYRGEDGSYIFLGGGFGIPSTPMNNMVVISPSGQVYTGFTWTGLGFNGAKVRPVYENLRLKK